MSESMCAALVAIDGDADRGVYRAMVERSRWNGWARAWFSLEECERMAAAADMALGDGSSAVRVSDSGLVLVGDEDGDGEGGAVDWHAAARLEVDGVTLYRVGDGWVWDEVDALEGDDDDDDAVRVEL